LFAKDDKRIAMKSARLFPALLALIALVMGILVISFQWLSVPIPASPAKVIGEPSAVPTAKVGQRVILSGRLYLTIADFTGKAHFYLIDETHNQFDLQITFPLNEDFFDQDFTGVTIVGYVLNVASIGPEGIYVPAFVRVESVQFGRSLSTPTVNLTSQVTSIP
jgi:hypothetical protein